MSAISPSAGSRIPPFANTTHANEANLDLVRRGATAELRVGTPGDNLRAGEAGLEALRSRLVAAGASAPLEASSAPGSVPTAVTGRATPAFLAAMLGTASTEGELVKELGQLRGKLDMSLKSLHRVESLTASALQNVQAELRNVEALRTELSSDKARLAKARKPRRTVGVLATLVTAVVFPPAASAVGFAALGSVDGLDRKVKSTERRLNEASSRLTGLQAQHNALAAQKAKLSAEVRTLTTEHGRVVGAMDEALAARGGPGNLSRLTRTRDDAKATLAKDLKLLGDFGALKERADALGTDVQTLKIQLEADVARAKADVAAVELELRQATFAMLFAFAGAAEGLVGLTADQAGALRRLISTADFFTKPAGEQKQALVQALAGLALPDSAAKVAGMVVDGLRVASTDNGRAAAAKLIKETAGLGEAQRVALSGLLSLPEEIPVLPLVNMVLGVAAGKRERALQTVSALLDAAGRNIG